MKARFDAIWAEAERRRDAGEPVRHLAMLGYAPTPGDGDATARPWMTEAELCEQHEIALTLRAEQKGWDAGASARVRARIAARRATAADPHEYDPEGREWWQVGERA